MTSASLTSTLSVPEDNGDITRRDHASGEPAAVVLCLQDLHGNPGVQLNEASIILHAVSKFQIPMVFVEGATGQGDLSILCSLPTALRRSFMNTLLKRAYLTGAEYAGARDPDANFDLWGVDDPSLYRKNWAAAVRVDLIRDGVVGAASQLKSRLLETCRKYISKDLWDVLELKTKAKRALSDTDDTDVPWRLLFYASAYSVVIPPDLQDWIDRHKSARGRGKEPLYRRWFQRANIREIERVVEEQQESSDGVDTAVDAFVDDLANAISEVADGAEAEWNRRFWFLLGTIDLAEKRVSATTSASRGSQLLYV